jgi:hypothetical protein
MAEGFNAVVISEAVTGSTEYLTVGEVSYKPISL